MSNTLSIEEITILSMQGDELYAYIKPVSLGRDWPSEIVQNDVTYSFEAKWDLPSQMKSYMQAARYKRNAS